MNPTLKKILLIIALLSVAVLIGFGLYWIFKKTTQATSPTTTPTEQTGQLPSAGERPPIATTTGAGELNRGQTVALPVPQTIPGGYYQPSPVKQIFPDTVSFSSLGQNGNGIRYYDTNSGKFYRLTADGQTQVLSNQTFYNVSNVTWAPKNDKAVLEYPDNSKIIYDFEKQKQVTLPKHWTDFSFSPDSKQLAAKSIGVAPENRWLVTINDDGSGTKLIEPMGNNADKVQMNWSPSRQTVAFSATGDPIGIDRQEILFVGLNHENFKGAIVEGRGFESQWSPTGQKIVYSVYSGASDFKPELWVSDAFGDNIGNNRQDIQINTWSNKCTFSSDNTLYCAVPRDLPQGAGILPDVAANNTDDMYKIDLKTGFKTPINLGGDYNVKNLGYDATKNKLYFTDGNQTGVFEIKL